MKLILKKKDCVYSSATVARTFVINNSKIWVPEVALLFKDNAKILKQLNQVLKEQIAAINIIEYKEKLRTKPIFRSFDWTKCSGNKYNCSLFVEKWWHSCSHTGYFFQK